jgi:myotubularin-related protein 14
LICEGGSADATLNIKWSEYKSWNIVTMTQNYLKLMTRELCCDSGAKRGVLVHCISGWDRTPLFVSLLRLSLWADGEIHRSLDALGILYLTLAYDWCLFGCVMIVCRVCDGVCNGGIRTTTTTMMMMMNAIW